MQISINEILFLTGKLSFTMRQIRISEELLYMIFVLKQKENIINVSTIIFGSKLDWATPKGEPIVTPSICL